MRLPYHPYGKADFKRLRVETRKTLDGFLAVVREGQYGPVVWSAVFPTKNEAHHAAHLQQRIIAAALYGARKYKSAYRGVSLEGGKVYVHFE